MGGSEYWDGMVPLRLQFDMYTNRIVGMEKIVLGIFPVSMVLRISKKSNFL